VLLSSWSKSLQEFTRFIWLSANPQTKPIDFGCESAENWQLPSTSTIAIIIITQPVSWYSFYRPTEGARLRLPRHYSEGAQPVPKAVYRSSCRDEHNLGPLTPQSDALTTRPLRPVSVQQDCAGLLHDVLHTFHDLLEAVWLPFYVNLKYIHCTVDAAY